MTRRWACATAPGRRRFEGDDTLRDERGDSRYGDSHSGAIFRRKQIYEELHPETRHGANQHTRGDCNLQTPSFVAATSEATGKDKSTVSRAAARGEALGRDLDAVAGTSLDKGVELDALAKMAARARAQSSTTFCAAILTSWLCGRRRGRGSRARRRGTRTRRRAKSQSKKQPLTM